MNATTTTPHGSATADLDTRTVLPATTLSPAAQHALDRLRASRQQMSGVMDRGRPADGGRPSTLATLTGTVADMLGQRSQRMQRRPDHGKRQGFMAGLGANIASTVASALGDDGRGRRDRADASTQAATPAHAGGDSAHRESSRQNDARWREESASTSDPKALWRDFLARSEKQPLTDAATGTLMAWWRGQPWSRGVENTLESLQQRADASITPWVRRHPLTAVTLGAAVGAGLVMTRPWKWSAVAAPMSSYINRHARPLPRRAWAWARAELRNPAMQAMVASVVAGVFGPATSKGTAGTARDGSSSDGGTGFAAGADPAAQASFRAAEGAHSSAPMTP